VDYRDNSLRSSVSEKGKGKGKGKLVKAKKKKKKITVGGLVDALAKVSKPKCEPP